VQIPSTNLARKVDMIIKEVKMDKLNIQARLVILKQKKNNLDVIIDYLEGVLDEEEAIEG